MATAAGSKSSSLRILLALVAFAGCQKLPAAKPVAVVPPPAAAKPTIDDGLPGLNLDQSVPVLFRELPHSFDTPTNPITTEKVELGRDLFFDARLSKNQQISCNSCHDLAKYGVDGQRFSTGHRGQQSARNTPTVFNAGEHIAQFWDGRALDLEEQAKSPMVSPTVMAMPSDKQVVAVLKSIPGYVDAFKKAFPNDRDPVSYNNASKAIGAFERELVTPSRFDKFVGGEPDALNAQEKKGLAAFVGLGCTNCHNGVAVGGTSFQTLGLIEAWPNSTDPGRFTVTKDEADRMKFRVPSLRNIQKTGPYAHDGSIEDLSTMVRLMAKHQLGKPLSDDDVTSIVAFLDSMTGELPKDLITPPQLPPSGPKTLKPDAN